MFTISNLEENSEIDIKFACDYLPVTILTHAQYQETLEKQIEKDKQEYVDIDYDHAS